jgi:NAD(P)-dependent dehydrogenase (short-subunit alcohol dehydrogenase family)
LSEFPPAINHERVHEFDIDVTVEASVSATVSRVVRKLGEPDILVNAAGIIGRPASSYEATVEEFDTIFGVNVNGVWLMTKHVFPT